MPTKTGQQRAFPAQKPRRAVDTSQPHQTAISTNNTDEQRVVKRGEVDRAKRTDRKIKHNSRMKLSAAFLATIATSHVTAQIKMLSKPKRSHIGIPKNAKPYSSSHRRLEEEDLAINATYSIQFSSCLDIKTYNPDLFDEDIIAYVKAGKVVSTKSYVLFTACPDEEACDDTYIVDLSTYLSTVVEHRSEDKENYCKACEEVEDACTDDDNDGGGKLISQVET